MNWIKDIHFEEIELDDICGSSIGGGDSVQGGSATKEEYSVDIHSGSTGKVKGIISPEIFCLECEYCNNSGACIQCDWRTCTKSFHVRCAISAGLITKMSEMSVKEHDKYQVDVYCEKHKKYNKHINSNNRSSPVTAAETQSSVSQS